ncbi:MAG: hypothetical protein PHQ91_03010 [Thermoanaerobaculaceae bacterium]|nr:hypothetical protein [Thermoanaerobaculaceae bacterium]TAM49960.1 MAG: hypothetical protein EPN53_08025 [Acidobacteriota bacterium]
MRLGLVGFVLELVLPGALAGALLLVVASHLPLWDLRTTAGLAVFAVLLVAASVLVSIKLDGFTLARRRKAGTRQLLNRAGPWPRLVKFILGGVVVPIAALVAANRVELPGHRTPMAIAIAASAPAPEAPRERALADAVLRATDEQVKIAGIGALQAAASPAALAALLRILDTDPAAIAGGPAAQALAQALAAYGPAAVPALAKRLDRLAPAARAAGPADDRGLFDRDLAPGLEAVRGAIATRNPDPAAQAAALARLQASADELRRTVDALAPAPSGARPGVPGLVMTALLEMRRAPDPAALDLARRVAADAVWSAAVRGDAILLVGALGDADDLPALLAHLDDPSALVQARALQAIATIERRLAPAGGG